MTSAKRANHWSGPLRKEGEIERARDDHAFDRRPGTRPVARFAIAILMVLAHAGAVLPATPSDDGASQYSVAVPPPVRGPYVTDPELVTALDCPTPACQGPLNFSRMIPARERTVGVAAPTGSPFNLEVMKVVLRTITADLREVRAKADATEGQLDPGFLTNPGSRLELVGIINRMDREFIKDPTQRRSKAQRDCGEISVIYRFAYSLRDRNVGSRLPVTVNLVFPALPSDVRGGAVTCAVVAQRWSAELQRPDDRSVASKISDLTDVDHGPLALIDGRDLERVEFNMQAYRKSASSEPDFGTRAEYLIRIFQWNAIEQAFTPRYLNNQVDRSAVLCTSAQDPQCATKHARRARLVAYLKRPSVVAAIDAGTLDIPFSLGVLAERASSISPGGAARSGNQPFWNAKQAEDQVITDAEITEAIDRAKAAGVELSYIETPDDFRTRLNQSTCIGCHQTRAIAGFHFPGADRTGTSPTNSVLLPGSPHFYGDQPRRLAIVHEIALGKRPTQSDLATSYASRPAAKFATALAQTQLIGGWGGACLLDGYRSKRHWACQQGLSCVPIIASQNDPGTGTCMPSGRTEVGDALERGEVSSAVFDKDAYSRDYPNKARYPGDVRIPPSALPADPPDNNFYGSHQEFYEGKACPATHDERRDAQTGGFPGGMLRLSECIGLRTDATCGLVASSGFNACIRKLQTAPTLKLDDCFANFTSYAYLRACDAASPCRDDYICIKPMKYDPGSTYEDRTNLLSSSALFKEINHYPYDPTDYGQKKPDDRWAQQHDRRGLCIPPYFVFQFRSDGHPTPTLPAEAERLSARTCGQ